MHGTINIKFFTSFTITPPLPVTFKQICPENSNLVKIATKKNRAPKCVCIVDRCTKYYLALKQRKGNSPLLSHGNIQKFYVDDSWLLVNKKKGAACYVFKATLAIYILLRVDQPRGLVVRVSDY